MNRSDPPKKKKTGSMDSTFNSFSNLGPPVDMYTSDDNLFYTLAKISLI